MWSRRDSATLVAFSVGSILASWLVLALAPGDWGWTDGDVVVSIPDPPALLLAVILAAAGIVGLVKAGANALRQRRSR
jgi:hypothetical protein